MPEEISFSTLHFEAAVRKTLNKFDTPIYESDLALIVKIEFDEESIEEDCCLLPYFTNLTDLSISMPVLQIDKLSNLKKLSNLEIEFTDSGLVDFSLFASLSDLNYLGLFGDLYSEITYCNVASLNQLPHLYELRIHEFKSLDLTELPPLPSLETFGCLFGSELVGIGNISKLGGLKALELCDVPVDSLDFLIPLDRNTKLNLCALRVKDRIDYDLLNSFPHRDVSEMIDNCN